MQYRPGKPNPFEATAPGHNHLGSFATAREAALAVAKHAKGEPVREAEEEQYEGYALRLSEKNSTGYKHVQRKSEMQVNPYRAVAPGGTDLGYFPTAREAALAVAKHAAGEAEEA